MIAIDTNILVYAVMQEDPHHRPSRNLVEAAARGLVSAGVFPQKPFRVLYRGHKPAQGLAPS